MTAALFAFPSKPAPQRKSKGYTLEFEESVWGPYPRKLNCSKFDAFKAWQKLDDAEKEQAIRAIPIYAASVRQKDEQFLPHCATWLNGKRFETVAIPAPKHAAASQVDWGVALRIYHATGRWNASYGGEPGTPTYRGPDA